MRTEVVKATVLGAIVAVPVVLATAGVLWFSANDASGDAPFSYGRPQNLAEAAGWADGADVLRRLWTGDDPNRVQTVRPEVISSRVTRATALEAAVWSRHVEVVRLLDREGAIVGDDSRRHLACIAQDLGATDIVEYLHRPGDPVCERGHDEAIVFDRSTQYLFEHQ